MFILFIVMFMLEFLLHSELILIYFFMFWTLIVCICYSNHKLK